MQDVRVLFRFAGCCIAKPSHMQFLSNGRHGTLLIEPQDFIIRNSIQSHDHDIKRKITFQKEWVQNFLVDFQIVKAVRGVALLVAPHSGQRGRTSAEREQT